VNKITKIILAVLGGINTTFSMFTPMLLASVWVVLSGLNTWHSYFFFALGLLATLFRAIKIGFLPK